MTQMGADPDDLRGLARSLRAAAGQLDALSLGLARRTRSTGWHGPDADRFTQQWSARHRPALVATSSGLVDLARRAEREASEQLAASADRGTAAPGPAAGPAGRPRPGTLPALPIGEDRYQGSIELRLGPVVAVLAGDLTIASLGGRRRRVVLAQTVAGGAVLSAGSSAELGVGGPLGAGASSQGATADARARGGLVRRRTWDLDEGGVDDLLARLAAEQAGAAATGSTEPLVAAAGALDALVEAVSGHDPGWDAVAVAATSVPTPTASEELVEVELAAGGGVGLGALAGLGARGQGATGVRVGTRHQGDATSTVLEVQGSATGALTSTLLRRLGVSLPPDAHRGVAVRVELPEVPAAASGPSGPGAVMVRVTTATDTALHDVVARVDLGGTDGARDVDVLGGSVRRLAAGDVAGAVAALELLSVDPAGVTVATSTGQLSGHSARAGAGAGMGLGAGATSRCQALHVDRR